MGILDVRKGGVRLGWDSPVKEVVHPTFVNLESRGGLGWLEGFNEWMVRCGLEFAGHPGEDEFVNNTGETATMDLTLHGKIQNVPASDWEVLVDPKPPHRIRVRGTVYEKFFYGPKLKLVAEVSTVPGSDSFRISDVVTNEGAFPQEFQLIYHGNYGSSILEANATVLTPTKSVTPMNAHAGGAIENWNTYAGPTKGFIEEVYLFEPIADAAGKAHAVLRNAKGDLATSLSWNLAELPYLTLWKNTSASEDGYVTGIGTRYGLSLQPQGGAKVRASPQSRPGRIPLLHLGLWHTHWLRSGKSSCRQGLRHSRRGPCQGERGSTQGGLKTEGVQRIRHRFPAFPQNDTRRNDPCWREPRRDGKWCTYPPLV